MSSLYRIQLFELGFVINIYYKITHTVVCRFAEVFAWCSDRPDRFIYAIYSFLRIIIIITI